MDAFFASVEQLDDPALRGKPVLVGHDGSRSVVAAASYEARKWGCHSAQPMAIAKRQCPQAIIVPVRGARYREVSDKVFAIFDQFSPIVEPLSIDEAFLDATGTDRLFGPPERLARLIKDRIKAEVHLTASVGVAPNKFLAKLASDFNKPDGLTVIKPQEIDHILAPLPITRIWGIGPVTTGRLHEIGIRTMGDLRAAVPERLNSRLGRDAEHYIRLAHGIDDRAVVSDREAKSIGHEQTFAADVQDADEVRRVLLEQVEQVARRLRKHGMICRRVAVKIRYGQFQTISRSMTLPSATDSTSELWRAARSLFDHWAGEAFEPVRLIGVAAEQLGGRGGQLGLFTDAQAEKQRRIDDTTDQIVAKYGKGAIRRLG